MSLEAIIDNALRADAGLAALIGQRLYLVQKANDCSYPCMAYQRISSTPLYAMGFGNAQGTFGSARFQFTIFGDTATGAEAVLSVRDALVAALRTFNASALPVSPAQLTQAPNFVVMERMTNEPQPRQTIFMYVLDALIWYQDQ